MKKSPIVAARKDITLSYYSPWAIRKERKGAEDNAALSRGLLKAEYESRYQDEDEEAFIEYIAIFREEAMPKNPWCDRPTTLSTHPFLTVWEVAHHLWVALSVIYKLVSAEDLLSIRVTHSLNTILGGSRPTPSH